MLLDRGFHLRVQVCSIYLMLYLVHHDTWQTNIQALTLKLKEYIFVKGKTYSHSPFCAIRFLFLLSPWPLLRITIDSKISVCINSASMILLVDFNSMNNLFIWINYQHPNVIDIWWLLNKISTSLLKPRLFKLQRFVSNFVGLKAHDGGG